MQNTLKNAKTLKKYSKYTKRKNAPVFSTFILVSLSISHLDLFDMPQQRIISLFISHPDWSCMPQQSAKWLCYGSLYARGHLGHRFFRRPMRSNEPTNNQHLFIIFIFIFFSKIATKPNLSTEESRGFVSPWSNCQLKLILIIVEWGTN